MLFADRGYDSGWFHKILIKRCANTFFSAIYIISAATFYLNWRVLSLKIDYKKNPIIYCV